MDPNVLKADWLPSDVPITSSGLGEKLTDFFFFLFFLGVVLGVAVSFGIIAPKYVVLLLLDAAKSEPRMFMSMLMLLLPTEDRPIVNPAKGDEMDCEL